MCEKESNALGQYFTQWCILGGTPLQGMCETMGVITAPCSLLIFLCPLIHLFSPLTNAGRKRENILLSGSGTAMSLLYEAASTRSTEQLPKHVFRSMTVRLSWEKVSWGVVKLVEQGFRRHCFPMTDEVYLNQLGRDKSNNNQEFCFWLL